VHTPKKRRSHTPGVERLGWAVSALEEAFEGYGRSRWGRGGVPARSLSLRAGSRSKRGHAGPLTWWGGPRRSSGAPSSAEADDGHLPAPPRWLALRRMMVHVARSARRPRPALSAGVVDDNRGGSPCAYPQKRARIPTSCARSAGRRSPRLAGEIGHSYHRRPVVYLG
jgi:hypothetical protein